ncbi:hypothetical protein SKAU_G00021130 [Synaphobranchus kaupii]|uniref:Uncharacterized protein n=1 Tax=Synaphobranchus kaupii TaxID=118154 RepID=A0A9Q1GBV5_SYNKA|nr:hypothetical protein SKAU_G00021130 [Synaphobranchus kaupii]
MAIALPNDPPECSAERDTVEQTVTHPSNIPVCHVTLQLVPTFEIRQTLLGTHDWRSILNSLDKERSITSKQRKLLVRLLVSHLLEKHGEIHPQQ